jgi:hypothetical protein
MTKYERLYTADEVDGMIARAKAAAQPEQEPVAYEYGDEVYWHTNPALNDYIRANGKALVYATPPAAQREWVGLTNEERDHIWNNSSGDVLIATEAKLKEKNT